MNLTNFQRVCKLTGDLLAQPTNLPRCAQVDSWRYRELRAQHRAHRLEVFESVGPARFGVTSTDVYFF